MPGVKRQKDSSIQALTQAARTANRLSINDFRRQAGELGCRREVELLQHESTSAMMFAWKRPRVSASVLRQVYPGWQRAGCKESTSEPCFW